MEEETSIIHLVMEHPIVLFVIGAAILMGLIFLFGLMFGRWQERKGNKHQ